MACLLCFVDETLLDDIKTRPMDGCGSLHRINRERARGGSLLLSFLFIECVRTFSRIACVIVVTDAAHRAKVNYMAIVKLGDVIHPILIL
jgi:hypothetical protein